MPFFRSARIELTGPRGRCCRCRVEVRYAPFRGPAERRRATSTRPIAITARRCRARTSCCSTRTETEGGGDWCGHFVGTSFIFSDDAVLTTLEGDPRFFFDDSQTPQAQGTGTEEWGGGGDYWGGPDDDAAVRRPPGRRARAPRPR